MPRRSQRSSTRSRPNSCRRSSYRIDRRGRCPAREKAWRFGYGRDRRSNFTGARSSDADASDVPEIQPILRKRPLFGTFAWVVYRCFNFACRIFFRLEVRGFGKPADLCEQDGPAGPFWFVRIIKAFSILSSSVRIIHSTIFAIRSTSERANFGKADLCLGSRVCFRSYPSTRIRN